MSGRTGGGRPHADRSRARAWALNVHYAWEAEGGDGPLAATLERTLRARRVAERRRPHLERIVEAIDAHRPEIDGALEAALENWRLERVSSIDRAVLRIATAEMLFLDDVPPKAALQEGIRLAERYGGNESAAFVNGVLDGVLSSLSRSG